jgi:N-acetylneuraminate lyase
MRRIKLLGLVGAAYTPFKLDGSLNLAAVERQVEHLLRNDVQTVFICGSTGEGLSLNLHERQQLAQRWMETARGTPLKVIVHVGSNCLPDTQVLAAQAGKLGVLAISALAPFYFTPRTLGVLVEWCGQVAMMAPETPFYFYDVPVATHVTFPMPDFLTQASDRVPTLNGIKFTNSDLTAYQQCLQLDEGAFDILWGTDQCLLSALAVGATGAIGTSYSFVAPLFHRLLAAFAAGDLATARQEQFRAVQMWELLASYGSLGASKAVMKMIGVDVGPVRLPNTNPTSEQVSKLRAELEKLGFFDWLSTGRTRPALIR